jgi:hypothetical protein
MTIPPVMFGESQFVDKNETDVEIRTVTLTIFDIGAIQD